MADGRARDGRLAAVAEAPSVRHLGIAALVAVIAMWMLACSSETPPTTTETETATARPTAVLTSTMVPTATVPPWEFDESTDLFTERTSSMAYLPADNIQGFETGTNGNLPGLVIGCGSEDSFFVGLYLGTYAGQIGERSQVRYRRDRQETPSQGQWYSSEIGVFSDSPSVFAQLLATATTHLLIQAQNYRGEWYSLEFKDVRGITDALSQMECYSPY